eukprot:758388-Hanusia_phi.AAC.4
MFVYCVITGKGAFQSSCTSDRFVGLAEIRSGGSRALVRKESLSVHLGRTAVVSSPSWMLRKYVLLTMLMGITC